MDEASREGRVRAAILATCLLTGSTPALAVSGALEDEGFTAVVAVDAGGPECTGTLVDADGVDIDVVATSVCKPTTAEEYYCDPGNKHKVDADVRKHLCEDSDSDGKLDKLIAEALYPECD